MLLLLYTMTHVINIPDDSLTPHTLLPAVSTVTEFWRRDDDEYGLLERLGVPYSVMYNIRASPLYSTEEEKRIASLQYYLHTVPSASWEEVAGVLWGLEEHRKSDNIYHQHMVSSQYNGFHQ